MFTSAFSRRIWSLFLLSLTVTAGCSELRGRRRIRGGNRLYQEGRYRDALEQYQQAESLVPDLAMLWLNKGLTCRQLMVPGAASPESARATDCAIAAFDRMKQLAPADPRGEQL